jgi:hypothetical protein
VLIEPGGPDPELVRALVPRGHESLEAISSGPRASG